MRTLIWFRSDLRVDDNPALNAAVEAAEDGVVALFVVSLEQWREHDWGESKSDFVLRTVECLKIELESIGIPLIVIQTDRFGELPGQLARLADELDVGLVFANREYEVNERRRDREVERALAADGRSIHWSHDQAVVPPGALKTGAGDPYSVYSPFRKAWVKYLLNEGVPQPLPAPRKASGLHGVESSRPEDLGGLPELPPEEIRDLWPAGEVEARRRLEQFARERMTAYADSRDAASLDSTSRLSPYLAVGALSVRRCLEAALEANDGRLTGGDSGVETWIGELVWRDFYRHVLVGFPRVSKARPFRPETERVRWRDADEEFEAWCRGRTGVPFVDAGMRELLATGFMHNRLRMVTAMFLTKDLLVDWRRGERFFMHHLVDGDLANNNGGWQWSASTGTDAAPYFRIFNPWTQGKRYDPDGDYIRKWVPELREVPVPDLHDPDRLGPHLESTDYPRPIVNHRTARIRAVGAFEAAKETA